MTDVIVIPEGEHSVRGPSSSERWLNCGDSEGGGQTKYAAEGSAAHTLSEWVRNEGKPAEHWKGVTLRVGSFDFKVGPSMIKSVNTFVEACAKIPGASIVEGRVHYEELVEGGFGTLDDARVQDGLCVVTDLKHGRGVFVVAKDNPQLKLYALGLFFQLKWLYSFDKILLRIQQPRRHNFDEEETTLGKLLEWGYDVVRPRAQLLAEGKLKDQLKAGPWCRFCGKKNTCSVRAAYKAEHDRSPDSPDEAFVDLTDPFV